jgi:Uncharacterized protein conserved in bacteria
MHTFLMGHAETGDWCNAVKACMAQLGPVPASANLGFLYVTDGWARELSSIFTAFREETKINHWVGTVGVGICCAGKEYYNTKAIAVMIAAFPERAMRVFPSLRVGVEEFVAEYGTWYRSSATTFAVVHGDPRNPAIPGLIARLASELPGGFLAGGMTSSGSVYPQIADGMTEGGISGVAFTDEIPVATALTQGCSLIGPQHEITQCVRNVLVRLDDRPALDVFYEDIGEVLARDLNKVAGYIFAALPIPRSDTGDYLVRNLVGIDPHRKLLAIGDIPLKGEQIMFCQRDGQSAWVDLLRMLHSLKQRINRTPRGGVYYSCLGRGRHLFGEHSEELQAIRRELGSFPLVGFFANGEICHDQLYGYTGVLTLFL